MTDKNQSQLTTKQQLAAKGSVAIELSDEGLHNLAGYFDVLIQMDFALKQRNERNEDVTDLQNASKNATQNN
jgi:hypothetical protein